MASLGSLWGSFTGDSQKRRADEAFEQSSAALQGGFDQGRGYVEDYYNRGRDELTPYSQQGQGANKLYGTYLGLDGADAQRSAFNTYAGSDPFRQYNENQANRGLALQWNKLGMLDSGNSRLAMSRAALERGSQDFNTYMQRLQGQGQQGLGAAGQLAGFANQTGGLLGQMRTNLGQQQAGNAIQHQNALSAADGIFGNNLLKVAALAAAPFTGGATLPFAFGGSPGGATPMGNSWTGKGQ